MKTLVNARRNVGFKRVRHSCIFTGTKVFRPILVASILIVLTGITVRAAPNARFEFIESVQEFLEMPSRATIQPDAHVMRSFGPSDQWVLHFAAPLSGTYTVGSGGAYPTLTAAVADYNLRGVSGPVSFSLTDFAYNSETYPIPIGASAGSTSTNTLTIKPAAGMQPTLGSASSTALVFDGAANVIIDGSNTVGGTTKDFGFGGGLNTAYVVRLVNSANNITLKNTFVQAAGVGSGVSLESASAPSTILNNTLLNVSIVCVIPTGCTGAGVGFGGSASATQANNILENSGGGGFYSNVAVSTGYSNTIIRNNQISLPSGGGTAVRSGIAILSSATDTTVTRNRVSGGGGVIVNTYQGISVGVDAGKVVTVANNTVYTDGTYGMAFLFTSGTVNAYFNSVFRI